MKPGGNMNPAEPAVDWTDEDWLQRVEQCRLILACHDFLSEAENERVKQRMHKWINANRIKRQP